VVKRMKVGRYGLNWRGTAREYEVDSREVSAEKVVFAEGLNRAASVTADLKNVRAMGFLT
jgi:hypothetical protein